jgi:hypothetical protein
MMTLWTVLLPLAQKLPDPNKVTAGWLGAVVLLVLAAAVVLLFFSFRKQLRKVNFDEGGDPGDAGTAEGENGKASHA